MSQSVDQPTFNSSFAILEKNAQMLRENSAPDIDKLVDIVTQSVDAYKVVVSRLDAIDESLKAVFGNLDEDSQK